MGDFMEEKTKKRFLVNTAYTATVIFLIFLIYRVLIIYLFPFLIGIAISSFVQSPSIKISRKTGIDKRAVCALLVILCFVAAALLLVGSVFFLCVGIEKFVLSIKTDDSSFVHIFGAIEKKYSEIITSFPNFATENIGNMHKNIINGLSERLTDFISSIISGVLKNSGGIIFSLVVTVVASIYIAKDFSAVKDYIFSFLTPKQKGIVISAKSILVTNVFKVIRGYAVLMTITFGELFLGLSLFGFKNAFAISCFTAVIDILPVLGTGTVLIPYGAFLMLSGKIWGGAEIILLYLFITAVRNFLEPKIIGKQIGIPPVISLLIMFCGLKLFGFFGMITALMTLVVIIELYKRGEIEL